VSAEVIDFCSYRAVRIMGQLEQNIHRLGFGTDLIRDRLFNMVYTSLINGKDIDPFDIMMKGNRLYIGRLEERFYAVD